MRNEVFITIGLIILIAFLILAGQLIGVGVIPLLALIGYSAYCGYHYKGTKNILMAALPTVILAAWLSMTADKTLANILMFAWFGSLIFVAMNADPDKSKKVEPKKCSHCGAIVTSAFCAECGTKIE